MKNWFKYITTLFAGAALLATSCEESDMIIEQVIDDTERGAILRTANLISNELPIGDATGNFSVELEVQDQENGALVSSVEVYVGFRDNTDLVGPGTDVAESLFDTVDASTFTNGPFDLPRFTFSATLPNMLTHVGRAESDITGGDQFAIRFELVLTDGRRYSVEDNTGNITGSFYSSPFLYTPLVICPVPSDYFTGDYSITQTSGSAIFGIDDAFTQTSVTVVSNGTARSIAFTYDPGGFEVAYNFTFDLVCGEIQNFTGTVASGSFGCDGSSIGQIAIANVAYDLADDSEFTIVIEDFNPSGGCGSAYEASLTFTKL